MIKRFGTTIPAGGVTPDKISTDPYWKPDFEAARRLMSPRLFFNDLMYLGFKHNSMLTFDGSTFQAFGDAQAGTPYSYHWAANGTNKAVFAFRHTGTTAQLTRSADGTANFVIVLTYTGPSVPNCLPCSLVDCGDDKLFWFEYDGAATRIWCSVDGGQNWGDNSPGFDDGDALMTAGAGIIDHYHGGVWDSTNSKLYIMTGDTNAACRVLICDDIDDFMTTPATWQTRWGLDSSGQACNADYVLNDNLTAGLPTSQKFRAVSMAIATVDSVEYALWTEDAISGDALENAHKANLATGKITTLATDIVGAGWWALTTSKGHVLLFTNSEGAANNYVRLYAVSKDLCRVRLLEKWACSSGASWYGVMEAFGRIWATSAYLENNSMICGQVDTLEELLKDPDRWDNNDDLHGVMSGQNFIENPRFEVDTADWTAMQTTLARETVIIDKGNIASLKITPDAAVNAAYGKCVLDANLEGVIAGNFATLSARIYLPLDAAPTQIAAVRMNFSGSRTENYVIPDSYWDATWHDVVLTGFVPDGTTAVEIMFWANKYGDSGGVQSLYVSDVCLVLGTRRGAKKMPGLNALA